MADLAIDVVRYGMLAVLILLFVYLVLRVGTYAVLRSIAEFRQTENKARRQVEKA